MLYFIYSALAGLGLAGIFAFFLGYSSKIIGLFVVVSFVIIWLFAKGNSSSAIKKKDVVFFLIFSLVVFGSSFILWGMSIFPLDDPQQIVLTLGAPLDGFFAIFAWKYLIESFCPTFVFLILIVPWLCKLSSHRRFFFKCFLSLFAFGVCSANFYIATPFSEYKRVFEAWFNDEDWTSSPFFVDNFVYLDSLAVRTDGDSKNLIFIIMESLENWDEHLIPEITQMEQEYVHFSSFAGQPSGGHEIAGSTCTIAATVSKTTGVPYIATSFIGDTIFPNAKSIYDVMKDHGYHNTVLQGTDARFADFDCFLNAHSVHDIYDINRLSSHMDMKAEYVKDSKYRPGITDRNLYRIAKNILDTLSQKEHFSLTIATIETHFPRGFYDDNCEIKPRSSSDEDMLKATIQCASKEVYNFVKWIQNSDFGPNTEIVIVGDHLFRGKLLIDHPDRRWIDIFINPSIQPKKLKRDFSSVDIAPSILESLGFIVPGHRMGFGASLFSDEPTLIEVDGDIKKLNRELVKIIRSPEYYRLQKKP